MDLELFYTVFDALFEQLLKHRLVRLVKAQDICAVALERKAQLLGERVEHRVAGDVVFGFERTGFGVESGMDDARIGFARPARHVVLFFEHGDLDVVTTELSCDGAADHARADDDDLHNLPPYVIF